MKLMAGLSRYAQAQPPSSSDTIANSEVVMDDTAASSDNTFVGDAVKGSEQSHHQPRSEHELDSRAASNGEEGHAFSYEYTDQGLHIVGSGVKKLIKGIQGLRNLGVEGLVDPLPKIAVVGDQSTGKSSLIEGISGIKVPRKAGCCTRCPLEINMADSSGTSQPWVCEVSLFKRYKYEGLQASDSANGFTTLSPTAWPTARGTAVKSGATRNRPLGPWVEQHAENFAFATVYTKAEVQEVLYWAQLAILNPSMPFELFVPGKNSNTTAKMQVKFSPNVISGPNLPNLAFYDLPGVINVAEVEDERYLVDLVKNLAKEYVRGEDCLNLLALPMTNDAANSNAARLVKEAGAQQRTIGVLTKPDLLQPTESYEEWRDILDGERFRLGFDYHVVKNNPNPEVDHATARVEEEDFFAREEPWATTLATYRDRCGTKRLQSVLSKMLTDQILTSLPRITEQVSKKALTIDAKLAELPEPPAGNLPAVLMRELTTFAHELEQHIDGGSYLFPFQKTWMNLALQFRKIMADSQPTLFVRDKSEPSSRPKARSFQQSHDLEQGSPTPSQGQTQSISLSSDDEKPSTPTPAQRSGKKRSSAASLPSSTSQKKAKTNVIPQYAGLGKRFHLSEIRDIVQDAFVAGIPNQVHPKAIERMCTMSVQHWDKPLAEFLRLTGDMVLVVLTDGLDKVFGKWKQTKLYAEAGAIIDAFVAKALTEQRTAAQRSLMLEMSKPMTLNSEAQSVACGDALAKLEEARWEVRSTIWADEQERKSGRSASGQGKHDKGAKAIEAQIGPDPFNQEIRTMAIVRGYYTCAFSRFVDTVCQGIQAELFVTCRNDIFQELQDRLGIMEPDANQRCAVLLAQDPQVEIRRAQLKKEKGTLAKAKEWLDRLSEDSSEIHLDQGVFATG
ncbi:P-loop containing nucleoside triphosphate hydrolase [Lasallia pustulata]|uniref:p-loop containing nucleoside triphosphate hydrolase n=1 Tax=Lasallia pustulata TaxID=136370 RepID=A0A1W5D1H5_9LECA|nr:P-loop containing nucleoside triphosphate hydrolase [Lasallia pustulata]